MYRRHERRVNIQNINIKLPLIPLFIAKLCPNKSNLYPDEKYDRFHNLIGHCNDR